MSDIDDCRKFVENLTRDRGEVMRAGDDKIAKIRARHAATEVYQQSLTDRVRMHNDRAFLLAEVDRQRADNERLFNEDTKTRHALKGWVFVCPDGGDEPTHERVAAVVAEVDRMRAEIERLRAERDEARDESNPVQEPVAWRNKKWGYFTVNPIASKHPDWEPLYTAQRPRQLRNALEGKP